MVLLLAWPVMVVAQARRVSTLRMVMTALQVPVALLDLVGRVKRVRVAGAMLRGVGGVGVPMGCCVVHWVVGAGYVAPGGCGYGHC